MITEDEPVLLRYWRDFLNAQQAHFDRCYVEQNGTTFVADDVNVAFLLTDEELVKMEIEKAVVAFIHSSSWPASWLPLTPRACLHLGFRAYIGLALIAQIVLKTPVGLMFKEATMQNLGDFRSGVRWFFLYFWRIGGKQLLAAGADEFLRKR